MTTQTDQKTNGDGRSGGSEPNAQTSDDWESLVREFEAKTGDTKDRSGDVLKALQPVIEHVQSERAEKQEKALEAELSTAIDFVKQGEGLKDLPNPILRGLLEAYAIEDKAFAKAFQNRGDSPAEWQSQLEKGRTWAAEQLKSLTKTSKKDDLAAAKAAVAATETDDDGGSEDEHDVADMINMNAGEWQQFLMKETVKARQ